MSYPVVFKEKSTFYENKAGRILKMDFLTEVKPVHLTFGLGAGILDTKATEPLGFITPSVAVDPIDFGDFSFSGFYGASFVSPFTKPDSPELGSEVHHGGQFSFTYSINPREDVEFRFLQGVATKIRSSLFQNPFMDGNIFWDSGLSIITPKITLYNIARVIFHGKKSYQKHISAVRPFFQENIFGVYGKLPKKMGIFAEWTYNVFFHEFAVGLDLPESSFVVTARKSGKEFIQKGWSVFFGFEQKFGDHTHAAEFEFPLESKDQEPYRGGVEWFKEWIVRDYKKDEVSYTQEFHQKIFKAFKSDSLDDFCGFFESNSYDEKIMVAAVLAAVALEYEDAIGAGIFAKETKKSDRLSPDVLYEKMKESLTTKEPILGSDCASINALAAEFLRRVRVEAYTVTVSFPTSPHLIAAAKDPKSRKTTLVDFGEIIEVNGNLSDALTEYGRLKGIPVLGTYIFGTKSDFVGYFVTPEGKIYNKALYAPGQDPKSAHIKDLLRARPKKVK